MGTIVIPTTQNIELEYPVAGVGERIGASLLDLMLIIVYVYLWSLAISAYSVAGFWERMVSGDEGDGDMYAVQVLTILMLLPAIGYSCISETLFNGQTFGKKLLRLRTVRTDGAPPGVSQYLLRWLMRIVDFWSSAIVLLPGLTGVIILSANRKGQRLGDIVAGTTVIKLKLVTTFVDTIFVDTQDDYQLVFPEIARLSDRDVSILKEVLDSGLKSNNEQLLAKLEAKVKQVTGISSKLPTRTFLQTVLRDYNHYYRNR